MRTLEAALEAVKFPFELELMQKQDAVKAAGWRRALLDLPVGYGKTAIATVVSLMLEPDLTVILVPPILSVQWVAWLSSLPGNGRALNYVGGPKHRAAYPIENFDYLVMSYQVFMNDYERLAKACNGANVLTIVDEAHYIKGAGKLWMAVKEFSTARDLILMSGTIISKPGDAYAYIKLMTPDTYRHKTQFENIHVGKRDIFKQPKEWVEMDLMQTNLNARRVLRTKEEVHAALPKVRFIPVLYDLDKDHMALYRRLMEEQLLVLDDGSKIDATTATRLYHAAQQIVTNYGTYAGDESKVSAVFDLIDTVADEIELGEPGASKLILWTIYKQTSRRVQTYMKERLAVKGKRSVAAYSEVNAKKSIKEFLEDPDVVDLVAQPGSAGAGLNPQHLCWATAFIEIPTTTIPFVQSYGRIDRKGQTRTPLVWLFVARGTIQEQLLKNLFSNDNLVAKATGSKAGIKDLIFPSGK